LISSQISQEERIAVWWCTHDRLGANIADKSSPVVDDKLLAESLGEPLPHQARGDVGRASGSRADDDAHRPRRIGLRPRAARDGREGGGTRGKMQELSTGTFHHSPPVHGRFRRKLPPSLTSFIVSV
jgi:hypothetical protein